LSDVSQLLANLLFVFLPLLGINVWGRITEKSLSWHNIFLVVTLFISSFLCTQFNFQISEGVLLNLSIVPLAIGFFILPWIMGLFTLFLYIFSQIVLSIFYLSDDHSTVQAIKTVLSLLPQGLFMVLIFAVMMCICSIWSNRLQSFSLRATGFVICLLLYTFIDYFYINYLEQFTNFNFWAFAGFVFVFNFTFVISARMIVSNMEKNRIAKELMLREEIYRRLVEDSPDAIAISIDRQWKFVNNALVGLFGGESKEQLISIPSYDFVPPDYVAMVKARVTQVEHGKTAELTEQVLLRLNGEPFYAETLSIPTLFHGVPAVHTVIRDVTKKKEEQTRLIQAEKLSVAGQLAAGIAHEIRNPLTAIKGFLKIFGKNPKEEYLNIISNEITRIEDIITELLMLTKPNMTQHLEVEITQTLRQIVTLFEPQAHLKNVSFTTNFRAAKSTIHCDENQLKQAFINFIKNGIEAMPNGGTIKIQTESVEDKLQIEFIDDGVGIPEDKLKCLGEPFFTTKETGTGLGFMVSKKIIEDHSGQLKVSSTFGKGTTIRITLPCLII
jgi:PAS domain S-box-containing protein